MRLKSARVRSSSPELRAWIGIESARLREPDDLAGFEVDIDFVVSRPRRKAGHRAHCAEQRIEEARADAGANVAHGNGKAGRRALESRVVAQAEMRLGHADREFVETQASVELDLLFGLGGVFDGGAAVISRTIVSIFSLMMISSG